METLDMALAALDMKIVFELPMRDGNWVPLLPKPPSISSF